MVFLLGLLLGAMAFSASYSGRILKGLEFMVWNFSLNTEFQWRLMWYVVSAGVVVILVSWLFARLALRPLAVMAETAGRLGPHHLGERLTMPRTSRELDELTAALNGMLDRLAAGFDSQSRFAANASHELRTPLAVQRTLVEVAMRMPGASEDVKRLGTQLLLTNERSERLIEGLLVLAESDRGINGRVPVRLDEVADRVVADHAELAAAHQVTVTHEGVDRTVPGDPVLLERLVANLVRNAILYNEPGGWVRVAVSTQPALTVANSGPHVPADAVTRLFDPFRRLRADRTHHQDGAGLGLSIVRSIAGAHDGAVTARPGSEGGLVVEVGLPGD
ncbi:sensor histidine kinase [Goodfellowiella coeruleoviolacea]|uniref:histidine kinase n=1 Tax=Goodfellowiella coeruleoviolacea TaxID=334858 RepID=A0AAE3GJV1_9PSEU|nr:ATP-binding protein [Goodfellowiella coeruleoviolacea]MCP2168888.1 Signal transduction histidine kinase [Goodfellowiella coeruleoviolacea]